MNSTYDWLYEKAEELFGEVNRTEDAELERLARRLELPVSGKHELLNTMADLRIRWSAEVFALGLQFGIRLTAPQPRNT